MFTTLSTLWPLLLLLSVPYLANLVVVTIYRRVQTKQDWAIEDDLPQTAGAWVRERAAALGIDVIVTTKIAPIHTNAFHPRHRTIQLTDDVHFKPDPVYWAIAAHELGHAHLEVWQPGLSRAKRFASWLRHVLVMAGLGLGLGNILYGLPGVTELAFGVLFAALIASGVEVLDEAHASIVAYRELRQSAHLTRRHLVAVRHVLFTAFSSYFVLWLSNALLLSQWQRIEAITGSGRLYATSSLTTLGWSVAVAITALGLVYAVTRIVIAVRAPSIATRPGTRLLLGALWGPSLLVLIWLVWDLSAATAWAWMVMFAFATIARIAGLFAIPLTLPLLMLRRYAARLEGPGVHRSSRFLAERADGAALITKGNVTVAAMQNINETTMTTGARVFELVKLAYVPLLVALWLL